MNKKIIKTIYKNHEKTDINNIFYIKDAKKFVGGSGNFNAQIIFIGEAPGAEEEITGEPFCGRSGKLLRFYLNKYNFNNNNSFVTNVVKFRPPNNRKPTTKEINIHGKILKTELEIIKPKIIVPIGTTATEFILESRIKMSNTKGQIIIKNNILIFPLFHPAYILRNKNLILDFENDIKELEQIAIKEKIRL
jgi:uracil-DNA glycosylase family 4